MAYQVIARKWRPQAFQDLVGQEHVSRTLLNALRGDRLPQALLFTGVRGTGKTSSARILAKSVRCPNAKDFVPCGVCSQCQDVANSRSLDVIEIDGASNNGVDAIRELRETVGYMPSSGRYKVYIIDEVHMLSTSAFNALLKTLEEPPAHVIFILATTEVQKIPSTILSRCQRFDFRRIPLRQIAAHLQKICEAENVKTEPEALWLIARHGDGSLRDSQSLLDQVITFCDGALTYTQVVDVLGLTDRTLLLDAVSALAKRDSKAAVEVIERLLKSGYDAKVFAEDLLEEIRNALLVRLCPDEPAKVVDLPDAEIENLRTLCGDLTDEDLQLLFDMTLKGINDLLRSPDSRLVLEMLLLRMAAAPRIASLAHLASGSAVVMPSATPMQKQTTSAPSPSSSPGAKESNSPLPSTQEATKAGVSTFVRLATGLPGYEPPAPKSEAASSTASAPATAQPPVPKAAAHMSEDESAVDPNRAKDPWYQFVESVKKSNSLLGAMLENTHLIETAGNVLTLGIPKKMSFLFDKVKDPENLKRIEAFLETFWNKSYTVDVKLADAKVEKQTPKAAADEHQAAQKRSVEQAVEQDPLVKTAQNVFKTQIKSIKDAGGTNAGKRE